ncbi:MAG: ABC transporter ATP-binding protein [Crocinitomicaceae bacterium]|nr:ABC transporter ATP-binding protein [Crocinitomicaceae bacterium]|tara:strand:+ start:7934 stop:8695 length:762 start_codon:yes stop_codon:yes gene_type:complete
MIEVKGLSKSFGDNHVLKNVNLLFEQGVPNLIIGASGSGKTTLVKCIVGLHEPDVGTISYDGRIFNQMNNSERKSIRKEIGFLFQGSALFDSMSVEENVMFPLRMFSHSTLKEMKSRVEYCLERVDLAGTNSLMPSELSGGMKKRVGIARAISFNPKYLFCDEPNSGLDPHTALTIDRLIDDITRESGITTIVITHDMNSVLEIGERLSFIYQGDLLWKGSNKEILRTDCTELTDFIYASEYMKEVRRHLISE